MLDIRIWAIGNWIIASKYGSHPVLSRNSFNCINAVIKKERCAIVRIECPLYVLAIHFTGKDEGFVWACMLSTCCSE